MSKQPLTLTLSSDLNFSSPHCWSPGSLEPMIPAKIQLQWGKSWKPKLRKKYVVYITNRYCIILKTIMHIYIYILYTYQISNIIILSYYHIIIYLLYYYIVILLYYYYYYHYYYSIILLYYLGGIPKRGITLHITNLREPEDAKYRYPGSPRPNNEWSLRPTVDGSKILRSLWGV